MIYKYLYVYILIINLLFNICLSSQINFVSSDDKVYAQHKEWKSMNHKNNFGYSSVDLIKSKSYKNQVEQFELSIDSSLSRKDININIASYDSTGQQSKIKLDFGGEKYITGVTPWLVEVCSANDNIDFNITCLNKDETLPCSLIILINSTSTMKLCSNNSNFNYYAIINDWFDQLVKSGDVIYHIIEHFIPIKNK